MSTYCWYTSFDCKSMLNTGLDNDQELISLFKSISPEEEKAQELYCKQTEMTTRITIIVRDLNDICRMLELTSVSEIDAESAKIRVIRAVTTMEQYLIRMKITSDILLNRENKSIPERLTNIKTIFENIKNLDPKYDEKLSKIEVQIRDMQMLSPSFKEVNVKSSLCDLD